MNLQQCADNPENTLAAVSGNATEFSKWFWGLCHREQFQYLCDNLECIELLVTEIHNFNMTNLEPTSACIVIYTTGLANCVGFSGTNRPSESETKFFATVFAIAKETQRWPITGHEISDYVKQHQSTV